MNKTDPKFTFVIIVLLLFMTNCGKKGPLKLEPDVMPGQPTEMKIFQEGDNLQISWKFPKFLKDNKTKLDIPSIKKVYFFYSEKPLTTTTAPGKERMKERKIGVRGKTFSTSLFLKKSRLLSKSDIQEIKSVNGIYRFTFPQISRKFLNKSISIGMNYKYHHVTSDLSDVSQIQIMTPVDPVTNLSLSDEKKVIKLKWSVNPSKSKGKKSTLISGFNVFRKIDQKDQDAVTDFKKINNEKILKEYFEDSDIGVSGKYSYYVTILTSSVNISRQSNLVTVDITDIFPPGIPQNLHIFKSKDGLMLTWKKVKEKDLAYYKIYRKEENSPDFNLLESEVKDNQFLDKTVKKVKKYFYYITSIDNNGNESDNSTTQSEQF